MRLTILVIYCSLGSCLAWLLPERCEQSSRRKRSIARIEKRADSLDIQDLADNQHTGLNETYKDYQFIGVPVGNETCKITRGPWHVVRKAYNPSNCRFITYTPRPLSTVACHSGVCKLVHTVTTQDSYTASEGYNWGVKITAKYSYLKIFEVSGEVSAGGTYTCAYTKGRTTTDTVDCAGPTGERGQLRLYNVKSDMKCDFGIITLELDSRDGRNLIGGKRGFLSKSEVDQIRSSARSRGICYGNDFMIDMSKISDRLLGKLLKEFPNYNPYTDLLLSGDNNIDVAYFKETNNELEFDKIIPFTNEFGDSVYQYACIFTRY